MDFSKATKLSYIGMFAFKGCSSLSGTLTLPRNITYIGTAAFQDCSSIERVVVDAAISEITSQMFYHNISLSSVILNTDLESIGSFAFADCPNLSYIEIPRSVTKIANSAFLDDEITLGVFTDSYAHQYAVSRGINYILLDAPEPPEPTDPPVPTEPDPTEPSPTEPAPTKQNGYILGDVDNSGQADTIDVLWIQRYAAFMSYPMSYESLMQGDVDEDGSLSMIDATIISRYAAFIEVKYPVGEFVPK